MNFDQIMSMICFILLFVPKTAFYSLAKLNTNHINGLKLVQNQRNKNIYKFRFDVKQTSLVTSQAVCGVTCIPSSYRHHSLLAFQTEQSSLLNTVNREYQPYCVNSVPVKRRSYLNIRRLNLSSSIVDYSDRKSNRGVYFLYKQISAEHKFFSGFGH